MNRRTTLTLAAPALAATMALSACGGSATDKATSAAGSAAGQASSAVGSAAGQATSSMGGSSDSSSSTDCPTDNTRHFAKTRFVTDVGLAAGTFHRWIYKPYKAGTFQSGAKGRKTAIVKGVAVAALDYKLISNAYENVKADPTLCKAIGGPLGKLKDSANQMKSGLTKGDLGSIANTEGLVSQVMSGAKSKGTDIQESTDESKAQLGND